MMGRLSGFLGRIFFGSGAISPLFRSSRGRERIEDLRALCLAGIAWRDGTAAVQSPGGYGAPGCGGLCAGALLPGRPLPAERALRANQVKSAVYRLGRELSPVRPRPKSRSPSEDNSSPEINIVNYPPPAKELDLKKHWKSIAILG